MKRHVFHICFNGNANNRVRVRSRGKTRRISTVYPFAFFSALSGDNGVRAVRAKREEREFVLGQRYTQSRLIVDAPGNSTRFSLAEASRETSFVALLRINREIRDYATTELLQ